MENRLQSVSSSLELPRPKSWNQKTHIPAPTLGLFTSRFGNAYPKPRFLESYLGTTALYDIPPPSGKATRSVLIIHGLGTPALGMWLLVQELQALDPGAHIVLLDLWGHGLSSTPLVAHTPYIFHAQILQVLSHMGWLKAEILGFSFGGATAVRFALYHPWLVQSVTLLAPAGLLRAEDFEDSFRDLLEDGIGKQEEAIESVLSFLEGGSLTLPSDWPKGVPAGEVMAREFRDWELQAHEGHRHSVLSIFRDGGISGSDEVFRKFANLDLKKIAVIAELDDVCTKDQLTGLGISNVEIVKDAQHGFVRTHQGEVAKIVHSFWLA